jgi:hypothetical protein
MEINAGSILGQTETNLHTQILRYVSADTAQKNWEPRASIFALQTANNLQIVEDNIRYVKLTFPLGNVVSWNGNMYNSLGRRTFLLQGKDVSFAIEDSRKFERCTIVQETNIKNAIEEIFIKSVYAENIGLIAFTNKYINTQNEISSGYFVTQKLIWHNK